MTVHGIPFKKIVLAGLCTGSLDILTAFVDVRLSYDMTPQAVLKYIGSAVFDSTAVPGSLLAASGLVFHYIIAFAFTLLFCLAYPSLKKLLRYELVIALVYGLFMQAVMRFGVLPLTRLKMGHLDMEKQIKPALILVGAFGIPLAFFMRWQMRKRQAVKTSYRMSGTE